MESEIDRLYLHKSRYNNIPNLHSRVTIQHRNRHFWSNYWDLGDFIVPTDQNFS